MRKFIYIKGQSLFELVVAIAISALIIVVIVSLVTNSLRNATFSKHNAQAVSYASEAVEWLRSQRDTNIDTFLTNAGGLIWCFPDLTWNHAGSCGTGDVISDTPFVREGHFKIDTSSGKTVVNVDIVVTWSESSKSIHEVTNSTYFTDWRQR